MTGHPRRLALLRIDDDMRPSRSLEGDEFALDTELPTRDIELLEFFRPGRDDEVYVGISSWRSAIDYWSQPQSKWPDIVVGDVRFAKDRTTPLNYEQQQEQREIPTGLSHLKAFAAINRALGRPAAIAIHTRGAEIWRELLDARSAGDRRMALLAAHEIGEVAAILGHEIDLPEGLGPGTFERCWAWLLARSRDDFNEALPMAVRNYRRDLVRKATGDRAFSKQTVFVFPEEWRRLRLWCASMVAAPQPIGSEVGLAFFLSDGRKDVIAIRSLFADVMPPERNHVPDPNWFALSAEPIGDEFLDGGGRPQIGAFIEALSSFPQLVSRAHDAVFDFPDDAHVSPVQPLDVVVAHDGSGHQLRAVIVLLQFLRWEWRRQRAWEECWRSRRWLANELRFEDIQDPEESLERALASLAALCKAAMLESGGEPFHREDVLTVGVWLGHEDQDPHSNWVRWHFDRLVDAGVVSRLPGDEAYRMAEQGGVARPPVPECAPHGLGWESGRYQVFLRDTLGFRERGPKGQPDDRAIGHFIARGFGLPGGSKEGRNFLAAFAEGSVPGWVTQLARDFAVTRLGWRDRGTWPQCLAERHGVTASASHEHSLARSSPA